MNEKEKRDRGEWYLPSDLTLTQELLTCKDLCFAYNQIRPSLIDEKQKAIKKIVGRSGKNVLVMSPFECDYGYNIEVGENFYSNHGLVVLDGAKVVFGDHVFIGPQCGFYTAIHPVDFLKRAQGYEKALPIYVGDHVWIGGGVKVLPGVRIGSHVVIGANSVVTHDIEDGVVAFGNPCRVYRKINKDKY